MTQGRLRRESNPTPGEEPGFTPQHESSTSGEFVTTGEGNPLPTKDTDVHSRLDQIEAKLDNIAGTVNIGNDETNAVPIQLTGSNAFKTTNQILYDDKVTISAFGDSITEGYLELDNKHYTYPNKLNHMISQSPPHTSVVGDNLFDDNSVDMSTGVSYQDGEFTLDTANDSNPRFAMSGYKQIPVIAKKQYLITAEINSSGISDGQIALRVYGTNSNKEIINMTELNPGGHRADTNGYKKVYYTISIDYLSSLNANVSYLNVGGVITGGTGNGSIRDIELFELEKGVAVHNQGVSGDDTVEALSRIDDVFDWSPDISLIALGTNDIRQNGISITKEEFLGNLEEIVIRHQEHGIYPILATLPPLASSETNYDQVENWNTGISSLADRLQVKLWDRYGIYGGDASYMADGRHPTAVGYQIMAWSALNLIMSDKR